MFPEWVVYGLAWFGGVSLAGQVLAGVILVVRRLRERARVSAAWKLQRTGVWP